MGDSLLCFPLLQAPIPKAAPDIIFDGYNTCNLRNIRRNNDGGICMIILSTSSWFFQTMLQGAWDTCCGSTFMVGAIVTIVIVLYLLERSWLRE